MGRKGVFPNFTRAECERILATIHKDFELRRKEHDELSKIQEEVNEHATQRNVLAKRKEFNEKYCILCCSTFNLLFNRKIQCHDCHFWVCRSCATWEYCLKVWICKVCEKQRILDAESCEWFYNHIKQKFKHFGSAKVLEKLCRKRKTSDSENDSGYGPSTEFKPFMTLFPSCSTQSVQTMTDTNVHDDDEGDEEDAEVHHSIETIIEGLLGSSLDDACVDQLYTHPSYYKVFMSFHSQLIDAIANLSQALQRALHNIPHENEITPTAAHAALKHIILSLVKECRALPDLQVLDDHSTNKVCFLKLKDEDIFTSYDCLVASAIINKVVEKNQIKYNSHQHLGSSTSTVTSVSDKDEQLQESNKDYSEDVLEIATDEDFKPFEPPLEYIQIEEIEEITREYTDSEDDKFSSISHQSSELHSIEDLRIHKGDPDGQDYMNCSEQQDGCRIPFPEFGRDLVEDIEDATDYIICQPTAVRSWEDNWLFRKKKRMPLYSNLKYQLLTYCDDPPCMLIPCPSENYVQLDTVETDRISELSESHSVGSLEFSSDSDEQRCEKKTELKEKTVNEWRDKFTTPISTIISQNSNIPTELLEKKEPVNDNGTFTENQQMNLSETIAQNDISIPPENKEKVLPSAPEDILSIPPRPGTIAEREHKKWLNAVPLENNPYSAANIARRVGKLQENTVKVPSSSFEEFEKKLLESSNAREKPHDNKLDCGLRSINVSLYKRDYYVNNSQSNNYLMENEYQNSLISDSLDDLNYGMESEEALNSLEEKVYISSGKVFTLENHVKRLERELQDISLASNEECSLQSPLHYCSKQVAENKGKNNLNNNSTSEDELPSLPSVKVLATKFNPCTSAAMFDKNLLSKKQITTVDKQLASTVKPQENKFSKNKNDMKIHSLTARSLSKEFRSLARQNLPRPMNRTVPVASQINDLTSERDCISPTSVPSPVWGSTSSGAQDLVHGYTSDESSTSTSSLPRPKARRHISRSILQRASYWERRAEQGLLSDASVSEEFPGVDINPD